MNSKRARSPFIFGLVLALLLTGCAAPAPAPSEAPPATEAPAATAAPTAPAATDAPATPDPTDAPARTWEEDVWVQGGWIQQNTLASQGGTIYAYLGDEGALYAFDREAGTKSLALQQGSMGRQALYYLTEQNGLLYAGGVGGSGGFAWADPATGESGGAGIFRALRLNAVAAEGETLYLAGQDLDAEKPGYGLYTAEFGKGGHDLDDMLYLEPGEALLHREGEGEISAVIPEPGALLLHEWVQDEAGQDAQRLVRLDLATGAETVLTEPIYNGWTPRVDGKYLAVRMESEEPRALQALVVDETGATVAQVELPEAAQTASPVQAGACFALDWTNAAGARTLALIDPNTGEILRSAQIEAGWSECLGSDGEALYFWNAARPDETSTLVAVNLEALEASEPFA